MSEQEDREAVRVEARRIIEGLRKDGIIRGHASGVTIDRGPQSPGRPDTTERKRQIYDEEQYDYHLLFYVPFSWTINKRFKRAPRIAWRFPLPGGDRLELRASFKPVPRKWSHFPVSEEEHDALTGAKPHDFTLPIANSNWEYANEWRVNYVRDSHWYTAILSTDNGVELRAWAPPEVVDDLVKVVRQLHEDLAGLASIESSHCCFCGKGLKVDESIARGYGPDCAKRFQLAWSTSHTDFAPTPGAEVATTERGIL